MLALEMRGSGSTVEIGVGSQSTKAVPRMYGPCGHCCYVGLSLGSVAVRALLPNGGCIWGNGKVGWR